MLPLFATDDDDYNDDDDDDDDDYIQCHFILSFVPLSILSQPYHMARPTQCG